jgi:endonuclease G
MMIDDRAPWLEAAGRWEAARPAIRRTEAEGPLAEEPERKEAYLKHQQETAAGETMWAGVRAPPLSDVFGAERVIGANDMISFDTLQKAIAIGRFVGMIGPRRPAGAAGAADFLPQGVATGSMVSPRLLLTNHHVLHAPDEAGESCVTFDYQLGMDGKPLPASTFDLVPDEFFVTDPALDYTLVAVAPGAAQGTPLAHFGWNQLIGTQGKILAGHSVNIIQHPEGGYKQIVLGNNRVLALFDDFFLYEADTLPGSSGAPVFNRQWEIVALHRRSVPRVVNGDIMTKGGQVWREGIPERQIDWIGNEGTRVSSLVRHLKDQPLSGAQAALRKELLERRPPQPFQVATEALERGRGNVIVRSNGHANGAPASAVTELPMLPMASAPLAMPAVPLQLTIALTVNVVVAAQTSQAARA